MQEKRLPEHLIELPGGEWAFWRWIGLRGAGFPAADIFKLSAPTAARAADLFFDAEEREQAEKSDLLKQINADLDALRRNNEWGNKGKSRSLLKSLSLVKADKIPADGEFRDAAQALRLARERVDQLRKEFSSQYEASVRAVSKSIREIAMSDRFREAVVWQNRQAYHTAVSRIFQKPADEASRGSKQKQHEELVASYVQRYFVKNDTIGFFGPVGWARFVPDREGLSLHHGKSLVSSRKTYFEVWCIEALANIMAGNQAVKSWLKPICSPFIRVDGTILHHPLYGRIQIPGGQAAILNLCDGRRTAREIVQVVMDSSRTGLTRGDQVYELLEQMEKKGIVSCGFNICLDPFPEKILRVALEGIRDNRLRTETIAVLDELETARTAVEASAGNADALDQALESLEATFTRLTGMSPTREAGKTYAARTLVYEDCRRDIDVELGADLLKSLGEPLSLLLIGGRWLTFELAKVYRQVFKQIYEDLAKKDRSRRVEAGSFWAQARPFVFGQRTDIGDPILADFSRRWERLLMDGFNERWIQHTVERLRPLVLAEFAAPRAGWNGARYHSPDIIIQALDPDHVNSGDFRFVLGEVHLGRNTLAASLFLHQHPFPETLIRAKEFDLPGTKIVPIAPKELSNGTARTANMLISPNDFRLEFARDSFAPQRSKALPISSFLIEEDEGELIGRTRDRQHQFNLLELMGMGFGGMVCDSFRLLAARPHTPRISIDQLVISRETWRFSPSDLTFAFEKNEASRFLGARRWARNHGIPRLVFTKMPVERKPCFVDFDSPIYLDLFSKLVRRTAEEGEVDATISLSEMLPGPDEVWLKDAEGQRYTSEFRIVALDLIPVDDPSDRVSPPG